MSAPLAVAGVEKSYGEFALGPLDLSVDAEVLAVLGPSGCGKTTLLSIVAGIVAPDAGSVRLAGDPLDGRPPEDRGVALLFQDGALFPHMTARENVAYAATDEARVTDLAATLELTDVLDQSAATLSGGQRQRVALARALAADPGALLLDEPLSNLDAPIKRRLREDLRPLLAGLDIPVLYVTHDQREAAAVGDRVAVLADGRVHQVAPPETVFRRPATPFVADFTGNTNVFAGRLTEAGLSWGEHTLSVPGVDGRRGNVQFCVRPERVALGGGENALSGRVRRATFEGSAVRVVVAPDGVAETVTLTRPPDGGGRVREGERVTLSFPGDAVHVFD